MRRNSILAIACAMVAVLGTSASAYKSYATSTGKPCGYCHVDPAGGGRLTPAGEYYFDNGTLPPETPQVPAAPTGLSAAATSTSQINLKWTDASSDETGFKVQRSASATTGFTVIATVAAGATTYSNTGLTASTTYYYRVCATNTAGDSAFSSVASAATSAPAPTAPAAPTGLSAAATSSSQINLKWTDASSNETGFKVQRSSSEAGPFETIATAAAGASTYSNTGLTASTTYYYRVCANNTAGDSGYSSVASAATSAAAPTLPAAPTGLSAAATSSSQINLKWTDASSNETGFKVQRSSSEAGPFETIATAAAGASTHSNTGLTASTTYYYRVCANNAAGDSGYSNVASAATSASTSTAPKDPTDLSAAATSSSQIGLKWTDASSDETGFKVQRSSNEAGPFETIATAAAGATSYSNTGLAASTTYYYRVCATNAAGDSGYSNVASAATPSGDSTGRKPRAPSRLMARAASETRIDLRWRNGSSIETGFKVERATSETGPFETIATLKRRAKRYADEGLDASTAYYYRVCAFNAAGDSEYSKVASASTRGPGDDDDDDDRDDDDEDDDHDDRDERESDD